MTFVTAWSVRLGWQTIARESTAHMVWYRSCRTLELCPPVRHYRGRFVEFQSSNLSRGLTQMSRGSVWPWPFVGLWVVLCARAAFGQTAWPGAWETATPVSVGLDADGLEKAWAW